MAIEETLAPESEKADAFAAVRVKLEYVISQIAEDATTRRHEGKEVRPYAAVRLIKEAKLGALRLPTEHGGSAFSIQDTFRVLIQLAEADPDVAHSLRYHFYIVEKFLLLPDGPVKDIWLARIAAGDLIGNGFTELNTKNAGQFEFDTALTADGEGFRLNGTKYFSTGTLYADWVGIMAAGTDGRTVQVFLPTGREGVEIVDDWDGFGQKLTGSGTTNLNHVYVERSEILEIPEGETPFNSHLQLYLQAVIAGILHAVVKDARELVLTRKRTFTFAAAAKPAEDPQLLEVIGQLSSRAFAAEAIVLAAAESLNRAVQSAAEGNIDYKQSHEASLKAAQAKVVIDPLAQEAASLLFDVGGASATRQSAQLDRHWRNIRTLASHNPIGYKARAVGNYAVNGKELPIQEVYF